MTTKSRIISIRLLEKINRNLEYAQSIGIEEAGIQSIQKISTKGLEEQRR